MSRTIFYHSVIYNKIRYFLSRREFLVVFNASKLFLSGSHIRYEVDFGNSETRMLEHLHPMSNQEYELSAPYNTEGNFTVTVTVQVCKIFFHLKPVQRNEKAFIKPEHTL